MNEALVSVVMPAYNASEYVERAIRSVVSQSYGRLELIVVDDGSTDDTGDIIRLLSENDPRVKVIYQENSGKPAIARNTGIAAAKGEYISFLDSDDIWYPDRLEVMVGLFYSHRDVPLCFSDIDAIDSQGNPIVSRCNRSRGFPTNFAKREALSDKIYKIPSDFFEFQLAGPSLIHTSAVLIRRSRFERGLYDTDLRAGEDVELWLRLIHGSDILYIDKPYSGYRKYRGSLTGCGNVIELEGYVQSREKVLSRWRREIRVDSLKNIYARLAKICGSIGYHASRNGDFVRCLRYQAKAFRYQPTLLNALNMVKRCARVVAAKARR